MKKSDISIKFFLFNISNFTFSFYRNLSLFLDAESWKSNHNFLLQSPNISLIQIVISKDFSNRFFVVQVSAQFFPWTCQLQDRVEKFA